DEVLSIVVSLRSQAGWGDCKICEMQFSSNLPCPPNLCAIGQRREAPVKKNSSEQALRLIFRSDRLAPAIATEKPESWFPCQQGMKISRRPGSGHAFACCRVTSNAALK